MKPAASAAPPAAPAKAVAEAALTPCIGLCRIDADTSLCSGCHRSLDEIARWSHLTNSERAAIMAELPARQHR